MRTKTLLLTAAIGAASLATSMAQVYSVNAVGYINLTLPSGFCLLANQLNAGANSISAVIPTAPADAQVLTYSGGNYHIDVNDGASWIDNDTGDPSTTVLAPGTGFFFFNPGGQINLTLVGEVPDGNALTVALTPGYKLVGGIVPQVIPLTPANGFQNVPDMQYQSYLRTGEPGGPGYKVFVNDGSGWIDNDTGDPAVVAPGIAQGFFIFNPGGSTVNWTRCFHVSTTCP